MVVLALALVLALGCAASAEGRDVKLGLQMYNFVAAGDWWAVQSMEDVQAMITRLAAAGYDGLEWCNFQMGGGYMDLDALKQMMDDAGLVTCGMHFHFGSFDSLPDDAAVCVERCQKLGTDKLIFAYSTPATFGIQADENGNYTPEQIDEWAQNVNQVIEGLQKAAEGTGIQVLYHNHNTEFLKGASGAYANDLFVSEGMEVDVYWASKGMDGKVATALEYVKTNADKVYLLHVKDGLDGSSHTGEMCGWGKGTYDIQSIIDVAKATDTIEWIVVENDNPGAFGLTGIVDAEQSGAYAATLDFNR